MLRCIFCGLCEEACPKQAVYLRHDRMVPVFVEREDVIFGKDKLVEKMDDRYIRIANAEVQTTPTEPSLTRAAT